MYIVVWTILIGFVVGLIVRSRLSGQEDENLWVIPGLGISGALFGSIVGRALGMYGPRDPASLAMAAIGAILGIITYRRYFVSVSRAAR